MTTDEERAAAQEAERACDRCGDPLGEQFNCYERTTVEGDPNERVTEVEGHDAEIFYVCKGCQTAVELELAAYQRGLFTKDKRRAELAAEGKGELDHFSRRAEQLPAIASALLGAMQFVIVGTERTDDPCEMALRLALELRLQVEDFERVIQSIVRGRRKYAAGTH